MSICSQIEVSLMNELNYTQERLRANLKHLRMSHYLTDKEIYQKIGLSNSTYYKIKRGDAGITLDTSVKICKLFGISLDDFVFTDLSKKSDMEDSKIKDVNEVLLNYGKRIEDLEDRIKDSLE